MAQVAFYELFERTAFGDRWVGTGTRKAAQKYDLWADTGYAMYDDEKLADENGWACKAQPQASR
jgi:hypothetical protein